jgi:hypothetical protein
LKPNYQFEKRRKALAKKQKQEEKRQRKLAQKASDEQTLPSETLTPGAEGANK